MTHDPDPVTRLYLASTSPARRALLSAAGIEPIALASHVDEPAVVAAAEREAGRALDAVETVQLLARAKAEAVADAHTDLDGIIVGGDSVFEVDGAIHGKPHTPEAARDRWRLQSGRSGVLHSGHWVIDRRHGAAGAASGEPARATVTFATLSDAEIDAYVATGEPLEVAGAFTIDSLGGPFITHVDGDPSTVVGLSLSVLRMLVTRLGVSWPTLWTAPGAAAPPPTPL